MLKAKGKHGGPRGPNKGGRPKGSKGKATMERELNAAQVIDRARKEGRDLAVTVLERLMNIADDVTGLNRPTQAGDKENPDGDWDRFGAWFDRAAFCARALAKYQSPQIKAMDAPSAPPDALDLERDGAIVFRLRIFEDGKPLPAPFNEA